MILALLIILSPDKYGKQTQKLKYDLCAQSLTKQNKMIGFNVE